MAKSILKFLILSVFVISLSSCSFWRSSKDELQSPKVQQQYIQHEKSSSSKPKIKTRTNRTQIPFEPKEYYAIPGIVHENMDKKTNDVVENEQNADLASAAKHDIHWPE